MVQMKDSGIDWIGKIPETWNVKKVKYLFFNKKYIPGILSKNYQRLALTLSGIILRDKGDSEGLQPKDFDNYQLINEGNLVFKLIDLQNISTSRVGLAHHTGLVSPAYIVLQKLGSGSVNLQFAEFFFLMLWHRDIFNALGDNGVRSSLNVGDLLNIPMCIPSIQIQNKIADFLDKKCSEIDSLSADIQTEIDTLEEYKKSVITEAVTKGLNPDVEMKDSGIEWIGDIPKNWRVEKLKFNLRRVDSRKKGNHTVLSLYRDYGVIPKDSRDDNHNVTSEDTSKYKYVNVGDFVINKMKAWQGAVAVSHYQGIVSPAYYVYSFTNQSINKKYFHYLLRSCYKDEFRRLSCGIREGQWDLPSSDLDNIMILKPSEEEQNQIADFLDKKYSEIDKTISEKQEQLTTLSEYKKSLIYEYVTGKKEVI